MITETEVSDASIISQTFFIIPVAHAKKVGVKGSFFAIAARSTAFCACDTQLIYVAGCSGHSGSSCNCRQGDRLSGPELGTFDPQCTCQIASWRGVTSCSVWPGCIQTRGHGHWPQLKADCPWIAPYSVTHQLKTSLWLLIRLAPFSSWMCPDIILEMAPFWRFVAKNLYRNLSWISGT